jgi:asparagine N-glycosylation enzyme membrane subunit Stt3
MVGKLRMFVIGFVSCFLMVTLLGWASTLFFLVIGLIVHLVINERYGEKWKNS